MRDRGIKPREWYEQPREWFEVGFAGSRSKAHANAVKTSPKGYFEAEAAHHTKFGSYWVVRTAPKWSSAERRRGRRLGSEPGYIGLWRGWTAPPPRVGPAAPNRWADTPAGVPPFVVAAYHALIAPGMRVTDGQRIRDHIAHIREQGREGDFASGIRRAEIAGVERHRQYDQLRWFLDGPNKSERDSEVAELNGFDFETVKRPPRLRERRKAGRKPIGKKAMTNAERMRRYRSRLEILKGTPEDYHDRRAGNRPIRERNSGALDKGRARPELAGAKNT
jgi:hypothetical protein